MPNAVCVKSLVPKEKNSAVSAISPAISAARGNSIMVPTWYFSLALLSAATVCAMASMRSLTRSSSALLAISGTMISGATLTPVARSASTAASKIARACISAISGYAIARRQPRKPSIGLNSCNSRARSASFFGSAPMACATSAISSSLCGKNSCSGGSSRRMVTGALHRQEFRQRRAARFLVAGQNHLAHGADAVLVEEHVLGAAEPDTLGAEFDRGTRIGRRVGIGAHFQRADAIGPFHQGGEFAGQRRLLHRHPAGEHLPARAVDGEDIAFLERHAAGGHGLCAIIDAQGAGAGDARLAHAAGDHRCVRGHAAARGQNALGGVHAVN